MNPSGVALLDAWRRTETAFVGLRTPGLGVLGAGVERYEIPGGGSLTLALESGDEAILVDEEGGQAGEVLFFGDSGLADPACLGLAAHGPSLLLALHLSTGTALCAWWRNRQAHKAPTKVPAHRLGCAAPAGSALHFGASTAGILVVFSARAAMAPFAQDTATPFSLYIRRQRPQNKQPRPPPAPLAEPLHDFNIPPGQAYAYPVGQGQFIQIIDVQGRECSDFQAFAQAELSSGEYTGIDPTTTRTLTGRSYPLPGLYAKYWSAQQRALVEVIQDTCGRHDSFGLACTARYYDDLGYPGHINCSSNINRALAPFAIPARAGWPAINFFYNTQLDASDAIYLDDPWSRPGDYVLLRALTDLVCVSTACPCDIDAANAWQPTDVQVRVYDRQLHFRKSIAYRKHTEAPMQVTLESPFHTCVAEYTREFVEYKGYWLARQTRIGTVEEYWACRERAALMDLSALRKFEVTGPDAETLLDLCLTRNVKKLSVGQVVYSAMCHAHGGMVDDGTLFRLGANNFRWVCGTETSATLMREQASARGLQAWVRESTQQLCNLALQGRYAREILKRLVWSADTQPSIAELGWFRFMIARLDDDQGTPLVISRTGYTGELGYEIFCHPDKAVELWRRLLASGADFDLAPIGLQALDWLRIEAGLAFAGQEFCDQTDPFEAGIGFTVALDKSADFIGKEALTRRAAHPARRLVGLTLDTGLVPASGAGVYQGRAQIGQVTSAVRSPILEQVIALARVDVACAELGTQLEVGQLDGHQKRLAAKVVDLPHFDPGKLRVKGKYD